MLRFLSCLNSLMLTLGKCSALVSLLLPFLLLVDHRSTAEVGMTVTFVSQEHRLNSYTN